MASPKVKSPECRRRAVKGEEGELSTLWSSTRDSTARSAQRIALGAVKGRKEELANVKWGRNRRKRRPKGNKGGRGTTEGGTVSLKYQ